MRTKIKIGKLTLTRRSYNDHPPYIWEFLDVDGNKREIVDDDKNVMRLIEATKKGSGKQAQANQRHDYDTDGLPAENLQPVMGGEGRPQQVGGQFVGSSWAVTATDG